MILQQSIYPSSAAALVSNLSISRHKQRAPVSARDGGGCFRWVALRVQHEPLGRKIGADSNDFDCFWGAVGLSGKGNGEGASDRPGLAGNPV